MATATAHLADHEIQAAVQDELEWTPEVDAAGIGVAVEDGCVSLSGEVDSYVARVGPCPADGCLAATGGASRSASRSVLVPPWSQRLRHGGRDQRPSCWEAGRTRLGA